MFFFEKMNQKTFIPLRGRLTPATAQKDRSFFASFFSKKEDSSFC
jgi:hypothetical protein